MAEKYPKTQNTTHSFTPKAIFHRQILYDFQTSKVTLMGQLFFSDKNNFQQTTRLKKLPVYTSLTAMNILHRDKSNSPIYGIPDSSSNFSIYTPINFLHFINTPKYSTNSQAKCENVKGFNIYFFIPFDTFIIFFTYLPLFKYYGNRYFRPLVCEFKTTSFKISNFASGCTNKCNPSLS